MSEHDYNLDKEIEEGLVRADTMLRKQKERQWLYILLVLCGLVAAFFLGFLSRPTGSNSVVVVDKGLYFSSNRSGHYEIYYLGTDGLAMQVTHSSKGQSWGAIRSPTGIVYFTSNRGGKSEVYMLVNGKVSQVTHSPGDSRSWGPLPVLGGLYFVSNRSGKNEIYYLGSQDIAPRQVTNTSYGMSLFSVGE